jgi:hypothetical protein
MVYVVVAVMSRPPARRPGTGALEAVAAPTGATIAIPQASATNQRPCTPPF